MSLASVLKVGAGRLGVRFFLVGILPTAHLTLFVTALHWSGAPGQRPDVDRVIASAADLDASEGLVLLAIVVISALLLEPLQLPMLRILEGYWGGSRLASRVARPLRRAHCRRRRELEQRAQAPSDPSDLTDQARADTVAAGLARRQRYPVDSPLQPTAVGNALRAAEEQAGAPYGLDGVTVWPRLYPLLGSRLAAGLDSQRNELDLAVRLVWVLAASTVATTGFLISHGWWLLVPAATAVLAAQVYRGAVAAAVGYGLLLRVAFDLHRFDLLKALRCPLPRSATEERKYNRILSSRLLHGDWQGFDYHHGSGSDQRETPA